MLVGKETFVPGKTESRPQEVTIKFTRDNLVHRFTNIRGCPIFHALKDAGIKVDHVQVAWYIDGQNNTIRFSRELYRASIILSQTDDGPFGQLWRRWKLQGKEFAVQV